MTETAQDIYLATQAKYIAGELIRIQRELDQLKERYPLFFTDVDINDPDLDLNRGFKNFPKRKKL